MATYQASSGWEALGDPSRLAIVTCLAERPRAVGGLADVLPISRPAVSQHLRLLIGGHVYDRGVDGSECRWPGCWCTSRRTGWCSAGASARSGRSRPSRTTRARSRSRSSPRPLSAPGRYWSTATSTGTAPAGRPSATVSPTTRDGRCTCPGTPPCSPRACQVAHEGPEGTTEGYLRPSISRNCAASATDASISTFRIDTLSTLNPNGMPSRRQKVIRSWALATHWS